MKSIRVLLADDHPVVLIGSRQILGAETSMEVVGEASSAQLLFARLQDTPCDVLVTDYFMPGGVQADGDVMLRKVQRVQPYLPVVVLTMTANLAVLSGMLAAGVLGIVDKTADIHELPAAVRAAKEKRQYISSGLRERFASADISPREARGQASLSPSELRVVHMYSEGLSITEIAEQLKKTVSTISRQKNAAMDKLGIDNNVQLIDFIRGEN